MHKPVYEGAGFPLTSQESEVFHPGLGLQEMRETNDAEQNDRKRFNGSLHTFL